MGHKIKMVKINRKSIFERKVNTVVITMILTIFFLGFFLGWNFNDKSITDLEISFGETQLNLNSISQGFEFSELFDFNNSCNNNLFEDITNSIYNTRLELNLLEKENKINSEYYNFLKEKSNINQVYFYSKYRKYQKICNNSKNIILFLFNASNVEDSKLQGDELNKLIKNHPKIIILPIDYGFSKNLNYFYNFYNVKTLPTLIINYDTKFEGQISSKTIEEVLK